MKGISYSIELASVFTKMYKNMTNHQEIQENIEELEKLVKPETPPEQPKPTFLNTLINLGWAQSEEQEQDIMKRNLEYDMKIKKLKKEEIRKAQLKKAKLYDDEKRELAVELVKKGYENCPALDKNSIANSIEGIVKGYFKKRKPHTKSIPLYNSKFEVL